MIPELNIADAIIAEIMAGRLDLCIPNLAEGELMKYNYMNEVEIVGYKVIFGVRLRARDFSTSESVFDIDLCAGSKLFDWEKLFVWFISKVKENINNGRYSLTGITPFTKVKPYFNDEEFMSNFNIDGILHSIKQ